MAACDHRFRFVFGFIFLFWLIVCLSEVLQVTFAFGLKNYTRTRRTSLISNKFLVFDLVFGSLVLFAGITAEKSCQDLEKGV